MTEENMDEELEQGPLSELETLSIQGMLDATDLEDNDGVLLELIRGINPLAYTKPLEQPQRRAMMVYLFEIFDEHFGDDLEEESRRYVFAISAAMAFRAFFTGYGLRHEGYELPERGEADAPSD